MDRPGAVRLNNITGQFERLACNQLYAPISLLKIMASSPLPYEVEGSENAQKVSRLVFAGLVEAEFYFANGRSDLYRGALGAQVTGITSAGLNLLAALDKRRGRKPSTS